MELFQLQLAPLVLKFGIPHGQTGRKGVSRREEEGKRGRVESQCIVGWVDFGLFFTFSTKVPLRFVTYLSKVPKIATKKNFCLTQ
jgi:hypothetical protein